MSTYLQIAALMNTVERAYQDALNEVGCGDFNPFELHIMLSLYRQNGQGASALARSVGRLATSFTPNLDRMERRGYLKREQHPHDRRAVTIVLTERGESLRAELTALAEQVERKLAALQGEVR